MTKFTATKGIVTAPVSKAPSLSKTHGIITVPASKSPTQHTATKGIVSERA